MEALLKPELYTGRCAEQVEALVRKVEPLIAHICREAAQIEL